MWPGKQRLRKEVVVRPVLLNAQEKKWPSLLVADNTAQHVNRKAILEVSCSETVRITDRPQQIIDERRTDQSNKSVQLRVKSVLLFSFCHIL